MDCTTQRDHRITLLLFNFGEVSNKRHTLISRTSSASSFRTYTELPARDHQHPGRFKGFLPLNSENYTKIQRSRRNFAAKQTFTTEREEARIRGTRKWLEKRDLRVLKPQHLPSSTCDRFEQFSPTNRNCRQLTTHYQRRKLQIGRVGCLKIAGSNSAEDSRPGDTRFKNSNLADLKFSTLTIGNHQMGLDRSCRKLLKSAKRVERGLLGV